MFSENKGISVRSFTDEKHFPFYDAVHIYIRCLLLCVRLPVTSRRWYMAYKIHFAVCSQNINAPKIINITYVRRCRFKLCIRPSGGCVTDEGDGLCRSSEQQLRFSGTRMILFFLKRLNKKRKNIEND